MLTQHFDNLPQRFLYGIRSLFADFEAVSDPVSENAQKDFYNLLKQCIETLYAHPEELGLPVTPDMFFRALRTDNVRTELDPYMKPVRETIQDFYNLLYLAGYEGVMEADTVTLLKEQLKLNKIRFRKPFPAFLEKIGIRCTGDKEKIVFQIPDRPDMIAAWHLLAERTGSEPFSGKGPAPFAVMKFACGLYTDDPQYLVTRAAEIHDLPRDFFAPYFRELEQAGFEWRVSGNLFETNIGVFGKVSGLNIQFNAQRDQSYYFMAHNCCGSKAMLAEFDALSPAIQDYMIQSCRPCGNCMSCTKNGKNKPFTMQVLYRGEPVSLCPQFPRREWFEPTEKLLGDLTGYVKLQETYG